MQAPGNTFPKEEKLWGKSAVSVLLSNGRWGAHGCIKYCFLRHSEPSVTRVMVSAPKKFFKRAVKRNLLKRRMREGYRLQKGLLSISEGIDILFYYNTPEIHSSDEIRADIGTILERISCDGHGE